MTVVPVGVDHTVFRPRDDVEPVPGRIMVTSSSDVPMKGLVPAARGGGQAPHRARGRAGGHRQPSARRSGGQGHRAARSRPDRALRLGDQRRRAGPATTHRPRWPWCPPSTKGSPSRPSRPWPAVWPWWPPPAGALPEVVGHRRRDRAARPARRSRRPGRGHRPAARRRRAAAPARCRRARTGARAVHLAGHRGGHRRASTGPARGRAATSSADRRRRPSHADRRLRAGSGCRPGDRLLDLGCGFGRHAYQAARLGAEVVAFDVGADEVRNGARHASARWPWPASSTPRRPGSARCRATPSPCPSPTASFDRVIASEVLEHIPDDDAAMAELARVLRPGGTMAVTVPRCGPGVRQLGALGRLPRRARRPRPDLPARRAGRRGLESAPGCGPTGSHHAHGLHAPYWWLRCLVGPTNDTHPAVAAYHRLLVWDIEKAPKVDPVRRAGAQPAGRQEPGRLPARSRSAVASTSPPTASLHPRGRLALGVGRAAHEVDPRGTRSDDRRRGGRHRAVDRRRCSVPTG